MNLKDTFESTINNLLINIKTSKVAVAVSGGCDSIALLFLLRNWAKIHNLELTVITVNHNLRPESETEVKYVYEISHKLGHKCFILEWDHKDNFSNLQERARIARYNLMTNLCLEFGILILATAHHKDDFLENFCIRKTRKSGIFGLSSGYTTFYNNVMVIRPLAKIAKNELVEFLEHNNISWLEDQSNYSNKYKRNKIRNSLIFQDKQNLEQELLEINKQASELQPLLIQAIAESLVIKNLGFAILILRAFIKFPMNIKFQVISYILTIIGGSIKTPRSESVKLIINLFENENKFIKTLHGCFIKKIDDTVLIYREFGKKYPAPVPLKRGAIWDNRFCFTGEELKNSYITHISIEDYIAIKDHIDLTNLSKLSINHHKQILFTLPIVKTLEKIVSIPHIPYYKNKQMIGKLNFSFQPKFISRFTHFF